MERSYRMDPKEPAQPEQDMEPSTPVVPPNSAEEVLLGDEETEPVDAN